METYGRLQRNSRLPMRTPRHSRGNREPYRVDRARTAYPPRAECALHYVLSLSPADREAFFNGVKDSGNRGIVALRGAAAAERFKADLVRLQAIRAARKHS